MLWLCAALLVIQTSLLCCAGHYCVLAAIVAHHASRFCDSGWSGFTVPPAAVKGCTYAEFNYVLDALNSAQRGKHAAAARDSGIVAHRAHQSEAQLRSAFTREDAAAGCADLDDQDEVDAGL